MGGNNLCIAFPSLHRRLDDLFAPFSRLKDKIAVIKERIWSKFPAGRRAKREWYARQPHLFLEGGKEERKFNPDRPRDENPIQYNEPAPAGKPHWVVDRDNRVWTVTDGEQLMTK